MKKKVIYKNNFKNDSIYLKSITFFKFIYILSITNNSLVKLVYKSITFFKIFEVKVLLLLKIIKILKRIKIK